ncbi:hypothetical protein GSI_08236 [Ganoderma sinense ZZ0214-1]|uniref:Uncharacterized protein n=1 Tax=Ganoderma sinense ZZ0214-1 TaxID=1077348 RepID=A0A2G8S745_9APHY|nr:hypothetical protein GSI_08236 [Ganoderma sinense ZZ0214-1]
MCGLDTTTWLLTGANRGIGLELTRQLLTVPTNIVVATCRNPDGATELHALKDTAKGTLHIAPIDVSSEASIRSSLSLVQAALGENGALDILYNNAAINEGNDLASNTETETLMRTMQVNVLGPMLLSQVCLPLLEKGKKTIVNVSSGLASIGLDLGDKCTSYSISKAALNMLTYKQKAERPDFTIVVIDPGWVKTALGGEGAQLEPEFSVSHIIKLVTSLSNDDSGKFFRYDGSTIPW